VCQLDEIGGREGVSKHGHVSCSFSASDDSLQELDLLHWDCQRKVEGVDRSNTIDNEDGQYICWSTCSCPLSRDLQFVN
jgi:hypothetical protein